MHVLKTKFLDIAQHQIVLDLPADPEQLLQDAAGIEGTGDPYWGILWPAAVMMAECVLKSKWSAGQRALELGCGAGLVGIAGLLAGLDVTFSDIVADAVLLASHNASRNGFANPKGLVLDWCQPQADHFDVILASDVLYERSTHRPLLDFLQDVTEPDGQCFIGDPGRLNARHFHELAIARGWTVELFDDRLRKQPELSESCFQLLVLTRSH